MTTFVSEVTATHSSGVSPGLIGVVVLAVIVILVLTLFTRPGRSLLKLWAEWEALSCLFDMIGCSMLALAAVVGAIALVAGLV